MKFVLQEEDAVIRNSWKTGIGTNANHLVSDFDRSPIVAYQDCGLSYHSIAAHVNRDPMTVCRIYMESVGSEGSYGAPCWISIIRYHQNTRRHTSYLHGLSGSYSHVMNPKSRNGNEQVSAPTVQCLQQHGLSS